MNKCKNCGYEFDGKFCPRCGMMSDIAQTPYLQSQYPQTQTAMPAYMPVADNGKAVLVRAGSATHKTPLKTKHCKWIKGVAIAMMALGIAFMLIAGVIMELDIVTEAYEAAHWTSSKVQGAYVYTYEYVLYTMTPEHYDTYVIFTGLSSLFYCFGLICWAVRKSLLYPEATKLFNKTATNFVFYDGLDKTQRAAIDPQNRVAKTYNAMRIMTYVAAALMGICAILYLWQSIETFTNLGQFEAYVNYFKENETSSSSFQIFTMPLYSAALTVLLYLSLITLFIYDIVLTSVRKKQNVKMSETLQYCRI